VCGVEVDSGLGGSDGIGVVVGFNAAMCDADLGK